MSQTLRTALYILLFAFLIQMQFNLDADKTATRQLKNALEVAVHDAALAIDKESFADGKVIFDQEQAIENLKSSLEDNLNVTRIGNGNRFVPNDKSFYKNEITLEFIEFIDDQESHDYPFNYSPSGYHIIETINGPSIIAIITTESPRWFHGEDTSIRQVAVYEYMN